MMTFLIVMTKLLDRPLNVLLNLAGKGHLSRANMQVLDDTKLLNCGLLLVGITVVYYLWKKSENGNQAVEDRAIEQDSSLD